MDVLSHKRESGLLGKDSIPSYGTSKRIRPCSSDSRVSCASHRPPNRKNCNTLLPLGSPSFCFVLHFPSVPATGIPAFHPFLPGLLFLLFVSLLITRATIPMAFSFLFFSSISFSSAASPESQIRVPEQPALCTRKLLCPSEARGLDSWQQNPPSNPSSSNLPPFLEPAMKQSASSSSSFLLAIEKPKAPPAMVFPLPAENHDNEYEDDHDRLHRHHPVPGHLSFNAPRNAMLSLRSELNTPSSQPAKDSTRECGETDRKPERNHKRRYHWAMDGKV